MELDTDDYKQILHLLLVIGGAVGITEFSQQLLREIHRLIPCEIAGYTEVYPDSKMVGFTIPNDAMFPGAEAALERYMHQHPLIRYYQETGDGRAIQVADFMTREEWRATDLYSALYEPLGVEQQMSIALTDMTGAIIGITVNRSGWNPFTERERELLDVLRQHIGRARDYAIGAPRLEMNKGSLCSLGLSGREADVLWWAAKGRTNREIAEELRLSPRTIQKHLQHIFDKLGVPNRTAAVSMALSTASSSADDP